MPEYEFSDYAKHSWLKPIYSDKPTTNQDCTAGRVILMLIDVPVPCKASQINVRNGTTKAGNVRVGIYRAGAVDDPEGGALVVESDSVAVASTYQKITFTETALSAGQYYLAIQWSDGTTPNQYLRTGNTALGDKWAAYYDRGGGYGAFTDPCPSVTDTGNALPYLALKVVS